MGGWISKDRDTQRWDGTLQATAFHVNGENIVDKFVNVTGDTMTGALTITEASTGQLNVGYDANNYVSLTIDAAGDFSFAGYSDGADPDLKFTPATGGEIDLRADTIVDGTIKTRSYGASLVKETPTATNPAILANQGDTNTGIGWAAADQLSLIAGGVEAVNIAESGGNITIDLKADTLKIDGTAGWSGTFTNGDGATVTVTDGIITDVS